MKIVSVDENEKYKVISLNKESLCSCIASEVGENFSSNTSDNVFLEKSLNDEKLVIYSRTNPEGSMINSAASSLNPNSFYFGTCVICKLAKTDDGYGPVGLEDEEIELVISAMGLL